MCNAHCCFNHFCVAELNDTLSPTSRSIPPYHSFFLSTRYQLPGIYGAENRSQYSNLFCTTCHIHVHTKTQTRHQVPGIHGVFPNLCSCSGYSNVYMLVGNPLSCAEKAFLSWSATTKTYQAQHTIHDIPSM